MNALPDFAAEFSTIADRHRGWLRGALLPGHDPYVGHKPAAAPAYR